MKGSSWCCLCGLLQGIKYWQPFGWNNACLLTSGLEPSGSTQYKGDFCCKIWRTSRKMQTSRSENVLSLLILLSKYGATLNLCHACCTVTEKYTKHDFCWCCSRRFLQDLTIPHWNQTNHWTWACRNIETQLYTCMLSCIIAHCPDSSSINTLIRNGPLTFCFFFFLVVNREIVHCEAVWETPFSFFCNVLKTTHLTLYFNRRWSSRNRRNSCVRISFWLE